MPPITKEELDHLLRLDDECDQALDDLEEAHRYHVELMRITAEEICKVAARTGLPFSKIQEKIVEHLSAQVKGLLC